MKLKAYLAEFLGTFALLLVGLSAGVTNLELTSVALAFGLTLMFMIYAVGSISGGHFNPAVSLGMAFSKRLSWKDFGFYVLFQLLGGLFAILCLVPFMGGMNDLASTKVLVDFGGSDSLMVLLLGLLVELVATFIFVFVILRVTSQKELSKLAGLIIGLTLAALIYFAGPLTNAGLNPIRSLMPALFEGGIALEQLWIFIVGPLVGGFLASVFVSYFDSLKA